MNNCPGSVMIEIGPEIFVDPKDVSSVEREVISRNGGISLSDCQMVEVFNGSRVILKNGRKIFVDGVLPSKILEKLNIKHETDSPLQSKD